jgi:hypothetical protein
MKSLVIQSTSSHRRLQTLLQVRAKFSKEAWQKHCIYPKKPTIKKLLYSKKSLKTARLGRRIRAIPLPHLKTPRY